MPFAIRIQQFRRILMNKIHIHVAVNELSESINFYSTLFGTSPSVEHDDYAKWQLNNPAINFAISKRGHASGINHLGIEVDSDNELNAIAQRLSQAEINFSTQEGTSCCYANSNKHWSLDPQGIAWESFHSLENIPVFGGDVSNDEATSACCIPLHLDSENSEEANCCIPQKNETGCCS